MIKEERKGDTERSKREYVTSGRKCSSIDCSREVLGRGRDYSMCMSSVFEGSVGRGIVKLYGNDSWIVVAGI